MPATPAIARQIAMEYGGPPDLEVPVKPYAFSDLEVPLKPQTAGVMTFDSASTISWDVISSPTTSAGVFDKNLDVGQIDLDSDAPGSPHNAASSSRRESPSVPTRRETSSSSSSSSPFVSTSSSSSLTPMAAASSSSIASQPPHEKSVVVVSPNSSDTSVLWGKTNSSLDLSVAGAVEEDKEDKGDWGAMINLSPDESVTVKPDDEAIARRQRREQRREQRAAEEKKRKQDESNKAFQVTEVTYAKMATSKPPSKRQRRKDKRKKKGADTIPNGGVLLMESIASKNFKKVYRIVLFPVAYNEEWLYDEFDCGSNPSTYIDRSRLHPESDFDSDDDDITRSFTTVDIQWDGVIDDHPTDNNNGAVYFPKDKLKSRTSSVRPGCTCGTDYGVDIMSGILQWFVPPPRPPVSVSSTNPNSSRRRGSRSRDIKHADSSDLAMAGSLDLQGP